MKLLVLTGYDDAIACVGDVTTPSKAAYAAVRGYDFFCERHYTPDSHPSWQKIRLLYDLLPRYDAVLWLDADTLVTNPEIRVEDLIAGHSGLVVSRDWSGCSEEDYPKHFSMGNFVFTNSPESFKLLDLMECRTRWMNQPLWEQQAIQEVFLDTPSIRPYVKILDRRAMNSVPWRGAESTWQPGDFVCHFTGIPNAQRLRDMGELFPEVVRSQELGARRQEADYEAAWPKPDTVPGEVLDQVEAKMKEAAAPVVIDPETGRPQYVLPESAPLNPSIPQHLNTFRSVCNAPAWHETGMCMDLRHLAMVAEIARLGWGHVIEIGTWTGCTTAAILAAGDRVEKLSLCDIEFSQALADVAMVATQAARLDGLSFLKMPGVDALKQECAPDYDLIIVDGDHSLPNVERETVQLLRLQPRCIVAHDVSSTAAGYPHCEGPAHLYAELIRDGWHTYVDAEDRPGEKTKRGLLAATKDRNLAHKLAIIFDSLS